MFRSVISLLWAKKPITLDDLIEQCNSVDNQQLNKLIAQLTSHELAVFYEKVKVFVSLGYLQSDEIACNAYDKIEDKYGKLLRAGHFFRQLKEYAKKSESPQFNPTPDYFQIPLICWKFFQQTAVDYGLFILQKSCITLK